MTTNNKIDRWDPSENDSDVFCPHTDAWWDKYYQKWGVKRKSTDPRDYDTWDPHSGYDPDWGSGGW